jgi:lactam utilization protein B
VQGRLREESIFVTIDTVCAHCDQPIKIVIDSEMKCEIARENADLHIFSPQIDWGSFSAPNIIPDF